MRILGQFSHSDFGTFDLENVRAWPKTVEIRVRVGVISLKLIPGTNLNVPIGITSGIRDEELPTSSTLFVSNGM
jgi:hypothetical protein